jgi:hypothetical protein
MNFYTYANNNPILNTDYWGLQSGLDPIHADPPKPRKPSYPPLPGYEWCYNVYLHKWEMCWKVRPPMSPPGDPRIPLPPGTLPPPLKPINPPDFFFPRTFPGGPKLRLPGINLGGESITIGINPGGGRQKPTLDCEIILKIGSGGVGLGLGPDEHTQCCLFARGRF